MALFDLNYVNYGKHPNQAVFEEKFNAPMFFFWQGSLGAALNLSEGQHQSQFGQRFNSRIQFSRQNKLASATRVSSKSSFPPFRSAPYMQFHLWYASAPSGLRDIKLKRGRPMRQLREWNMMLIYRSLPPQPLGWLLCLVKLYHGIPLADDIS